MLTEDAIKRRETYSIRDQAGVSDRRAKGDTIMRAVRESAGVIIEAVDDMILQTDITYAPVSFTFCLSVYLSVYVSIYHIIDRSYDYGCD